MRWYGLILAGGCFSPSPPAGAPCPDGACPSGLVCAAATMTCEKTGVAADAPRATPPDTPDGCYGSGMTVVCPDAPLAGTLVITNGTALDTTTSTACLPYHLPSGAADTAYCVIGATAITVAAQGRWSISGGRPLILVGAQIQIDGLVDVASHRTGTHGPGANPAACIAGTTPGDDAGGPGGSFGSAGGAGGASEDAPKTTPAPAAPKPLALRGGPGGAGNGNNGGPGGSGGGALQIIAAQLTIAGTINASGEAGDGAGLSAGGGGGGSGGMIVLEAPAVTVTGRVFANGGGGGEGGGPSNGGDDGVDPTAPATLGLGGAGNAGAGGDGGDGAGSVPATAGQDGDDSGGGGGGGAGVIRVVPAQALGGSIAPPPTT